jgi:hypothetical protein
VGTTHFAAKEDRSTLTGAHTLNYKRRCSKHVKGDSAVFLRVLKFVRLPLVIVAIYAIARFLVGVGGVPYAPRGNAMFSVLAVTIISSFLFGGLSGKVGKFGWGGAALTGALIGLWAQLFVFGLTVLSFAMGVDSYYTHWDSLNVPEGTAAPMGQAVGLRAVGLVVNVIIATVVALIGRACGALAPSPETD